VGARFWRPIPTPAVFHTSAWLEAWRAQYKYEPIVYGVEAGGRIVAGIPFCKVSSFITGRRLVSLAVFQIIASRSFRFRDHLQRILTSVNRDAQRDRIKLRRDEAASRRRRFSNRTAVFRPSQAAVVHMLDIARPLDELTGSFHAGCIRRKIAKAEREGLEYEEGRSEELLRKFYALLVMTRRRHCIPPQPLNWFRNLIDCLEGALKIRVASKNGVANRQHHHAFVSGKPSSTSYSCSDPNYKHAWRHDLPYMESDPGCAKTKDRRTSISAARSRRAGSDYVQRSLGWAPNSSELLQSR